MSKILTAIEIIRKEKKNEQSTSKEADKQFDNHSLTKKVADYAQRKQE